MVSMIRRLNRAAAISKFSINRYSNTEKMILKGLRKLMISNN